MRDDLLVAGSTCRDYGKPAVFRGKEVHRRSLRAVHAKAVAIERASRLSAAFAALRGN